MRVTINGEATQVDADTVAALVTQRTGRALSPDGTPADGGRLGLAVAVNDEVVPRRNWQATALTEGATIEIVTATQGARNECQHTVINHAIINHAIHRTGRPAPGDRRA
ncbi:sulfur carrier protein ThiS [Propionibacterium freudenreichii]|uniref:sulfur carrier protein ThiS n=1 Tax=Propionibacterium freudenreichii TaxID=1744 RepID=UPI00243414FC|nr:sulfur carrier protein ThiS [Propionibacterium freudenreichii]WFF32255.1 sulfur carrier protein ThiS [Propionibacterium freudenreichii]